MWTHFLDAFFPPHDAVPEKKERPIVDGVPIFLSADRLRSMGIIHLDALASGAAYHAVPLLKSALQQFKYHRVQQAHERLMPILLRAFHQLHLPSDEVITWVPLHWSRKFWRGFDQSEILAKQLSLLTGLPCRRMLKRVRPTGHQAWRSGFERRRAMHDAFRIVDGSITTHVLIVDDVATTGTTLDACGRVLKESGVAHVDAITVALG